MNKMQANHRPEDAIWIIPLESEALLRNPLGLEVHPMITFSALFGLPPRNLYSSLRLEAARELGTGLLSQSVGHLHPWLLPLPDRSSPNPAALTLLGVKGLRAWGWAEDYEWMGARDPAQVPPLTAHHACYSTTTKTPPLRLDPGAAFLVSACRGLLQTPPPSPGATRNSLLQQILGEARLSGGS